MGRFLNHCTQRVLVILSLCLLVTMNSLAQQLPTALKSTPAQVNPSSAKVRMLIFKSKDCPECGQALDTVLPQVEQDFPGQVEMQQVELTEGDNVVKLFALEKKYGDMDNSPPVIFMGKRVLGGPKEVEQKLLQLIPEVLAEGGCDYPVLTEADLKAVSGVQLGRKYLAYFKQQGCLECDRVTYLLLYLRKRYPSLEIKEYDIGSRNDKVLDEAMCIVRKVPERLRLVVPSMFIGNGFLVGDMISREAVENLLNAPGADQAPWNLTKEQLEKAEASLGARFRSLKIGTIAAAGLLDGINPCEFATIIFFISYLAMIGRKGKELLLVGAAFSAAVFLTYFMIGLGFFQALRSLAGVMQKLSIAVYIVIAVIAFVIGAVSLYDFVLIRRGKLRDMKLQLPAFLKRRIQLTISKRSRMRHYLVGAAISGSMVSVLELACTGQVYLPTITWAVQDPALRQFAFPLLIVYNLMFIVPLVVIILLTYYGFTSKDLTAFLERRAATVKLATALLFFAMSGVLVYNAFI